MEQQKPITALDRCDRCQARAKARTVHNHRQTYLHWCSHHFVQHEDALSPLLVAMLSDTPSNPAKTKAQT